MFSGNKPKPSMTRQPDVDKVYTGESVSLDCTVEASSGWVYQWFKDGTPLPIKNRTFSINDANLSNSGNYSCMATRDKTTYNTQHSERRSLRVSSKPKKITFVEEKCCLCLFFKSISCYKMLR